VWGEEAKRGTPPCVPENPSLSKSLLGRILLEGFPPFNGAQKFGPTPRCLPPSPGSFFAPFGEIFPPPPGVPWVFPPGSFPPLWEPFSPSLKELRGTPGGMVWPPAPNSTFGAQKGENFPNTREGTLSLKNGKKIRGNKE